MSLRKLLPSPNAIFMFEAAARHLSFTSAAREFNVTQSAVSRMIARLESHLDARLFHRLSTGIELTDDGRILFEAVGGGFQQIEAALDYIRSRTAGAGTVTLSAVNDRGNGTPPFRVKGTPVRACEGHAG